MEAKELREAVLEVLSTVLKHAIVDLQDDDDLTDRGLTSFESVSLVLALEERFDVAFPDDVLALENFKTVGKIMAVVGTATVADAEGVGA